MKRDPGGTLTTICMLIPMVAVPWFAIRGTQDLPSAQSQAGDTEALSYTDFETPEADLEDAPPFPGGNTQLLENDTPSEGGIDWDPFDPSPFDPQSATQPRDKVADAGAAAGSAGDASGGLGGAQVRPGTPGTVEDARPFAPPTNPPPQPGVPAKQASHSQPKSPAANSVTGQWKGMIRQLEDVGMRNYRVETTEDRSKYFVIAFFPDGPALRRIEGQGQHPLTALQDAVKQVRELRSGP